MTAPTKEDIEQLKEDDRWLARKEDAEEKAYEAKMMQAEFDALDEEEQDEIYYDEQLRERE